MGIRTVEELDTKTLQKYLMLISDELKKREITMPDPRDAQIVRLRARLQTANVAVKSIEHDEEAARNMMAKMEAQIARLVEALLFYGDESVYETHYEPLPCDCCTDIFEPINEDKGAKARAALAAMKGGDA